MIDALIAGSLRGSPCLHKTREGATFSRHRLSAIDRNGDSLSCVCIAFNAGAQAAIHRMNEGDSFAHRSGAEGHEGHSLVALVHGVGIAYHVARKREVGVAQMTRIATVVCGKKR